MDTVASSATSSCPIRPTDVAYQITASDYSDIDGDILLGNYFPKEWCLLAAVNCDPSEAGTLLYYEDNSGFGFSMDISGSQLTFRMRQATFSNSLQLCDNKWNQFSICYGNGALVMTKDCANAQLLGRPSDPMLSTITGGLTIFTNGSNDFSVSQLHIVA